MSSPTAARRRMYNATGDHYETGRYGDRHMESYRSFRDHTLLSILHDTFGDQRLRILEVGCGTGLTLDFLAKHTQHVTYGSDLSETMLRQAAEKMNERTGRVRLALADAAKLPYREGFFDVVFATRFIHQFEHETKRRLWQELQRVTRTGGLMVIEFYARPYHWVRYFLGGSKGRSRSEYFYHFPSKREVRDIVQRPFETYPLRLLGSRVIANALGDERTRTVTRVGGRLAGGLLVDEYFLAARKS